MIILGVDPGTLITGYGVIDNRNGKMAVLACDAIRNNSNVPLPVRLKRIFDALNDVMEKYSPEEFAIETAFYGKNAQSALKLGHARGVAMLAAVLRDIPTREYSPREVKKAIVGKGSASKQQVQYMIASLLKLKQTPKYYDVTDALAVAVCHVHRRRSTNRTFKDWKSFLASHPEKLSTPSRRSTR
jgi:crossover junction endodeoxyribonuclease RuvC